MKNNWILACFFIIAMTPLNSLASKLAFRSTPTNLTSITWAHAVNTQALLNDVLTSEINMIEADIVLGTLINDTSGQEIPVMGHPPTNISDISLESFMEQILEFNKNNDEDKRKGVKLDFKSIEVFNGSFSMLTNLWNSIKYPVWLNADIIRGPVNNTATTPVDPVAFLNGCKKFPNATLSIGWTTNWGSNFTDGNYTTTQIDDMERAIKSNGIMTSKHAITFPVRAGIAAQSLTQLANLMINLNETNDVTLTIWSSENDNVDIDKLRHLIFTVGIDKVYIDVPKDILNQLDLGNNPNKSATINCVSLLMITCLLMVAYRKNKNI